MRTLLALVRDEKPDFFAVAFDHEETTFRERSYAAYKANRPEAPDDLVAQIPRAIDLVRACGIPIASVAGYEADDLLATLAGRAAAAGHRVSIVSGDKDLCQVVSDRVTLLAPSRDLGAWNRIHVAEHLHEAGNVVLFARFDIEGDRDIIT